MTRPRTWLGAVACVVALAAVTVAPGLSSAQESEDPRGEREQVREQRSAVAAQLDALAADDEQIRDAIAGLDANIRTTEARLEDAERAAAQAEEEHEDAQRALAEITGTLRATEIRLSEVAIDAYIQGRGSELQAWSSSDSPVEAARLQSALELQAGQSTDLADQLEEIRIDRADIERVGREAADEAEARRAEVEERHQELEVALAEQQDLAREVDQRINSALAEAASLAAVDQQLSAQIEREMAALAAILPAFSGGTAAYDTGPVEVTTVRGIVVNVQIADQVEAMLSAAEADGLRLTGSGYRDPQQQIALRRAHCGSSDYAVYRAPASSCSPPTAQPGSSMHERGLAIDFDNCSSRGTACFGWLSGNAGRFGFHNLPSEPWHWSVNGR